MFWISNTEAKTLKKNFKHFVLWTCILWINYKRTVGIPRVPNWETKLVSLTAELSNCLLFLTVSMTAQILNFPLIKKWLATDSKLSNALRQLSLRISSWNTYEIPLICSHLKGSILARQNITASLILEQKRKHPFSLSSNLDRNHAAPYEPCIMITVSFASVRCRCQINPLR